MRHGVFDGFLHLAALRDLCDEGNQTAPAFQMRKRLLTAALQNLPSGILLTEEERRTVQSWADDTTPGRPMKAPIPSWPPSS